MATPHFAMVDIPFDGELRWGTRTAAAMRDERTADPAGGLRVFYGASSRDLEEPTRMHLATGAYDLLRIPSFKRHLTARGPSARRQRWYLWEAKSQLREVEYGQLAQTFAAAHAYEVKSPFRFRKALVAVSPAPPGTDPETFVALLIDRLSVVIVGATSIGGSAHLPAILKIGHRTDPKDDAAVLTFRELTLPPRNVPLAV